MSAGTIGLIVLAPLVVGTAASAGATNWEVLLARFPNGVPWRIQVLDESNKILGNLEVVLTSQPAKSCQKDFGRGYLVSYRSHPAELGSWPIGNYGIASVSGDTISLDLSGGRCDDYVMTKGELESDGTSMGEVFALHKVFGHDLGTYRATLR